MKAGLAIGVTLILIILVIVLIAIIKPTDSVVKIEPEKIVITNTVSNSSNDNNDSDYVESGGDTDETISR